MSKSNIALNSLSMLFLGVAVEQFHTNLWVAAGCAVMGLAMQIAYDYLPY